jgi:hypothetical protein
MYICVYMYIYINTYTCIYIHVQLFLGLGANALNDASVKSIFAAKKRPSTDPLIVHILSKDDIYDLFDFDDSNAEAEVCMCIYTCIYIYVCACMYVFICIYI